MPTLDELLASVRDFLHRDVMGATAGRLNFMARVAGNSLDIVRREVAAGPELRLQEQQRLQVLLGCDGQLPELRWRLVYALRNNDRTLDEKQLTEYLRFAVVNQVAIDQPKYSGFQTAVRNAMR